MSSPRSLIHSPLVTKVPGDKNINFFSNSRPPDLNDPPNRNLEILSEDSRSIPIKSTDLFLISNLNVMGSIEYKPLSDFFLAETDCSLNQQLISSIRLYPATYVGRDTPNARYGCQIVAGKFKDQYDLDTKKFRRNLFIDKDYFSTIAHEDQMGRVLVAFDQGWIIPAIKKYIEEKMSYQMEEPAILREQTARYNPVESSGEVYIKWDTNPIMRGETIPINQLSIH